MHNATTLQLVTMCLNGATIIISVIALILLRKAEKWRKKTREANAETIANYRAIANRNLPGVKDYSHARDAYNAEFKEERNA